MFFAFSEAQLRRLCGYSYHQGIWLSDGVLSVGKKQSAFLKRQVVLMTGAVLAAVGTMNLALYSWWQAMFLEIQPSIFNLLLLFFHMIAFDLFVGAVLITCVTALLLPYTAKQFHAVEHKVLQIWKAGEAVNHEHLKKAPMVYESCGVNIVSLSILFFAFLTVFPMALAAIAGHLGGVPYELLWSLFAGVTALTFLEYKTLILGSAIQRLGFLREPNQTQLHYAVELCRDFLEQQYVYQARQELQSLRLELA